MFAKTYTRKQAGVIYAAVKRGDLKLEREAISELYDNADGIEIFNTDDAERANDLHYGIKNAIDAIFGNDYAFAQSMLDGIFA